MAKATWIDFTYKYGFNDGSTTESRDYDIRTNICKKLNATSEFKKAKVKAHPFDCGGIHNNCHIILLPFKATPKQFEDGKVQEVQNIPEVDYESIVSDAYNKMNRMLAYGFR